MRYGWVEEETGGPVEVMGIELYMAHVSATKIIADAQRKSWSAGMVNRVALIGCGQRAAVL